MIPSEQQAIAIGMELTGDRAAFEVFSYAHKPSNLTAFGITITATNRVVTLLSSR
jgi:hypothetical protein